MNTDAAKAASMALRKRLMPTAVKLGTSTADLISATVEAAQAGVSDDILGQVTELGAKYAKMNKLALPNVLEETGYAIQGLKTFGKVTDETVGKFFNHSAYLIATTAANRTQMNIFAKRGLAAGASMGMSLDDTIAFGAAATASGAQGSQAARMLSTQTGRSAQWEMKARDIMRKRHRTEEDRLYLQIPQATGFSSFAAIAQSMRRDYLGTRIQIDERLRQVRDPLKRRSMEKELYGQEFGAYTDSMVMSGNLREYREKVKDKQADNFIEQNWSKETGGFGFILDQIRAVFGNLKDSLGLALKPIFEDIRNYVVAIPEGFGNLEDAFRSGLRGFMFGIGSPDGTMAGALKSVFGDPTGFHLNVRAVSDFAKGFGEGMRSVYETVRRFVTMFTGADQSAESLGRLTAKFLGFSAVMVTMAPAVAVLSGITTALLGLGSIVKGVASAIGGAVAMIGKALDLLPKDAGAGAAGAEAAAGAAGAAGIAGRALGTLGRLVPAIAAPLTMDPSNADQDRLNRRLGAWALEQERHRKAIEKNTDALIQRQSYEEGSDFRSLIHRTAFDGDTTATVQRAVSSGSIARAAGIGQAGSVMGAAGIPYSPGAGGSALYGNTPGKAFSTPGIGARFGMGGVGSSSPAPEGQSDPIPGTLNPRLAGSRKSLMDELDRNPALKRDVIKTASMENRGSPQKMQAVLESMVNRAKMNGYTSLNQAIHSGFYGPVNRGGLRGALSEKDRRDGEAALAQVKAGSNMIGYRTDQGMLTDPGARKYMRESDHSGHKVIGGENFFYMGQKGRAWAKRQASLDATANAGNALGAGVTGGAPQAGASVPTTADTLAKESPAERLAREAPSRSGGGGAAAPSQSSIHAPINVHGAGDPETVANSVQKKIKDLQTYRTHDIGFQSI